MKRKPKEEPLSLEEAIDDSENLTDFLLDFEEDNWFSQVSETESEVEKYSRASQIQGDFWNLQEVEILSIKFLFFIFIKNREKQFTNNILWIILLLHFTKYMLRVFTNSHWVRLITYCKVIIENKVDERLYKGSTQCTKLFLQDLGEVNEKTLFRQFKITWLQLLKHYEPNRNFSKNQDSWLSSEIRIVCPCVFANTLILENNYIS